MNDQTSKGGLRRPSLLALVGALALFAERAPFAPEPTPRATKPRVSAGRNDRCPCGSGKKFKTCCR